MQRFDRHSPSCAWVRLARILAVAMVALLLLRHAEPSASAQDGGRQAGAGSVMAGFAREDISPPLGTRMAGSGFRDLDPQGVQGIHDPLFVRAVYLKQGDVEMLIVAFDLLFISREESDQFKGALGRALELLPKQILFNSSHTHTAPYTHKWAYMDTTDRVYVESLARKTVAAALKAREVAQPMTIWAGKGETILPISRRLPNAETGKYDFAANPQGLTYNGLPVCVFRDLQGKDQIVLFSVAAHLSSIQMNSAEGLPVTSGRSYFISADFAGETTKQLDEALGHPGSMFLQGCGGCAKCALTDESKSFLDGTWEQMQAAGQMVAADAGKVIADGLKQIEPGFAVHALEMNWPFQALPDQAYYKALQEKPHTDVAEGPIRELYVKWTEDMIRRIELGYGLPKSVPVTLHGIKLGKGLRMVGLEGEATAPFAFQMEKFYAEGITFPLSYIDGCHMYLPDSKMIEEGGYEVDSYWEYRMPGPLAPGMEQILDKALSEMRSQGVD